MEELFEKINKLYGVKISSFSRVDKGFLSENYILVSDKNKFFLKKYRFDNAEKIREIHSVKKYFSEKDIPVILPIPYMENKTFFELNDSFFALFPFVESGQFERGALPNNSIVSLGKFLGKIHLAGKNSDLKIESFFKVASKEKMLEKIGNILIEINKKNELNEFDKMALQSMNMKKELILSSVFNLESPIIDLSHLIHGDFLEGNVFFDKNGNVEYIFDFEKSCYSPITFELFRMIFYCFLNNPYEENLKKAKLFFESYLSVYPMSKGEIKEGLELFFFKSTYGGCWVESEHYLEGNSRVDLFLEDDHKRIKYISENADFIKDFFINCLS